MHKALLLKFETFYLLVTLLFLMCDFESLKMTGVPAAPKICVTANAGSNKLLCIVFSAQRENAIFALFSCRTIVITQFERY